LAEENVDKWNNEFEFAEAYAERLREENQRLQSQHTCLYCAWNLVPRETDNTNAYLVKVQQIVEHMKVCPNHPMRAVEQEREQLRTEVKQLKFHAAAEQISWEEGYQRDQAELAELRTEVERLKGEYYFADQAVTAKDKTLQKAERDLASLRTKLREREARK
jgi:hypothetical protein